MEPTLYFAAFGFGAGDLALLMIRVITGLFFVCYRFRWIYDPSDPDCQWFSPARKMRLINRLCSCGYGANPIVAAAVAIVEVLAGIGLVLGFLAVPSAFALVVILLFANCCLPKEEIPLMKPVDRVDVVACYLRLIEPLYLTMALAIILLGPGKWSLDYLIWTWWVS